VKALQVRARAVDPPAVDETIEGDVSGDIRNRSVLTVGHTFVKGVDLVDGHAVWQTTDVKVSTDLEATRTYSSAARGSEGIVGAGWALSLWRTLTPYPACGLVVMDRGDGTRLAFRTADGGRSFASPPGHHATLRRNDDGTYDFTDKGGSVHHFGGRGYPLRPDGARRLDAIDLAEGGRVSFRYDVSGRLEAVSRGDAVLKLSYTSAAGFERVASIEVPGQGMRARYEYDDFGNLVRVTREGTRNASHANGTDYYRYLTDDAEDPHQLVRMAEVGERPRTVTYYGDRDRMPGADAAQRAGLLFFGIREFVKEINDVTERTAFSYDHSGTTGPEPRTTVTLSSGDATVYVLGPNGSPLQMLPVKSAESKP
jgi:hypothetical protein